MQSWQSCGVSYGRAPRAASKRCSALLKMSSTCEVCEKLADMQHRLEKPEKLTSPKRVGFTLLRPQVTGLLYFHNAQRSSYQCPLLLSHDAMNTLIMACPKRHNLEPTYLKRVDFPLLSSLECSRATSSSLTASLSMMITALS